MSGPPENITPGDLWEILTSTPRPSRVVDIPRKKEDGTPVGQIRMWPLTQQEQMECNAAAERFTKESLKASQKKDEENLGYHHTYANETSVQMLYRACRKVEDPTATAFPSPKLVRMTFTGDEMGVLFNTYLGVARELGPVVNEMTIDEMEAWIAKLAEGSTTLPFELLSWDAQRSLVLFMASALVKSWTSKSSAGSLLDERPQSTEDDTGLDAGAAESLEAESTEPVTAPPET